MRKFKLLLARAGTRLAWELFYQRRRPDLRIPILCYHRVLPELIEDADDPLYTLLPEQFEAQMAFLAAEGFTAISLQEFGELATGAQPVRPRTVVVTFDDGFADLHEVAWPLARTYGIKLNLFVSTGFIGEANPVVMTKDGYRVHDKENETLYYQPHLEKFPSLWRPLTWQQLGEMSRSGVHFGFHGHHHRDLTHLNRDAIVQEIAPGMEVFRQRLGLAPKFFALPYGGYGTNLPELVALLREMGLEFIFTVRWGRARLPSKQRVFPRLYIHQQDTLETFRQKLCGAYDWLGPVEHLVHLARGRFSRKRAQPLRHPLGGSD